MTEAPGRVLGIDLGEVRIGLALSDALRLTAQPLSVESRRGPRRDLQMIAALVREHDVRNVVVGLPRLMSGAEGTAALAARAFADALREHLRDVPVDLVDERLTTVQAERTLVSAGVRRKRRKQVVDKLAASLILQSFLDEGSAASQV